MSYHLTLAAIAGALISSLAYAQGAVKGDPAKARSIVTQVCAACHGADGNSPAPANPSLAGQHAEYIFKQLTNFKAQGDKAVERSNAVMVGMVSSLSVQDMSNLAVYFAGQKPTLRAARDPELARLGQAIYRGGIMAKGVAACASCHLPDGAGVPAQFPRLAGQYAEYTEAQLKAFRAGERTNDPNRMMRAVSAKLSDREIKALAEYIAGLR
ncbi:MAG: cytochrome C [Betaproteobacteria bacterium RIFCSPLOWO2_12_FULL_62_13]|nr:MAG: cytochrome C [Betaproteobacteria bacterium RIFCSPLOWO2_12_FULL_62_13]